MTKQRAKIRLTPAHRELIAVLAEVCIEDTPHEMDIHPGKQPRKWRHLPPPRLWSWISPQTRRWLGLEPLER